MKAYKMQDFCCEYSVESYYIPAYEIQYGTHHFGKQPTVDIKIQQVGLTALYLLAKQNIIESKQREKYPAVKDAYEQYQMLLGLTKESE
jgi:hypothetical protein